LTIISYTTSGVASSSGTVAPTATFTGAANVNAVKVGGVVVAAAGMVAGFVL